MGIDACTPPTKVYAPASTPPSTPAPPIPPPGATRLITRPDDVQVYTAFRETDVRGALTRGLAEYMTGLSIEFPGGRRSAFKKVLAFYAEPEQPAEYPSAVVYAVGIGNYDASKFTPSQTKLPDPDKRSLVCGSEFTVDLMLEIWTTDPKERMALVAATEDAMVPVDFMYGARLEMPHYFNARGTFEMMSLAYAESEEDAMRRYRKAIFTIRGRVPVLRLSTFPPIKARVDLYVDGNLNEC